MSAPRPWGDYLFRLLACALLFGAAYGLLSQSTFALRLRDDAPGGSAALALALAAALALAPLLAGRRFLGAFLVSAFVASGVGAYWWTKVSWDELVSESDFNLREPAGFLDYVLVAAPVMLALFYVAAGRASRLKAEYRGRGVDPRQVTRAACVSYLAGVFVFLAVTGVSLGFWAVLASGALFGLASAMPTGVPALVVAAALMTVGIALGSGRFPRRRTDAPEGLRRPSRGARGRAGRARSRAQRSPS